jgi:hypothetical protein
VALYELDEALTTSAFFQVRLEYALKQSREFAKRNAIEYLAADRLLFARPAAKYDVVPFALIYFSTQQTDVAYVVLGT